MRKLFCMFLSIVFAVCFCSCNRIIYIDDTKEQKAYNETLTSLFNALDNGNADTVYDLFSPVVREQDKELKGQIDKLLLVYKGPIDEIGWDGLLAGEASYEDGERCAEAYSGFPVRAGNTYFWFYLNLMYENTMDEKQIGITQLEFYTADEYCILCYDEDAKIKDYVGLKVYAEQVVTEEIRCIHGQPHKYLSSTDGLNIDDVKNFFENSNSFSIFKSNFGEPNAQNIFIYYELSNENSKTHYLKLYTDADEIYRAEIVDDFKYIETVFNSEEQ